MMRNRCLTHNFVLPAKPLAESSGFLVKRRNLLPTQGGLTLAASSGKLSARSRRVGRSEEGHGL